MLSLLRKVFFLTQSMLSSKATKKIQFEYQHLASSFFGVLCVQKLKLDFSEWIQCQFYKNKQGKITDIKPSVNPANV